MILSKSIYFMLFLILPILILNIAWWQVLIGFVIMHLVAGMILSIIFQMAHVVENTDHPDLNLDGDIENTWAIHQMQTTANFANRNKLLTWFCGGLNYQIEHHLFPNICHVHYPEISQIVKETAREYQVPYFHNETFPQAVVSHFKMLKKLGSLPPKEKILKEWKKQFVQEKNGTICDYEIIKLILLYEDEKNIKWKYDGYLWGKSGVFNPWDCGFFYNHIYYFNSYFYNYLNSSPE